MNYLNFAIRNIVRHKKRSFSTIFTICLGFTALIVTGGILNNLFSDLKEQAIVTEKLGHITFAKKGFFKQGKIAPEKYLWSKEELNNIINILKKQEDVVIATPRLQIFGVASNGKSSTIFITEAIVPIDDEKLIKTDIDGKTSGLGIVSLSKDPKKKSNVAVSAELASNLGLEVGDYLTLLTTTKDGAANAVDVDIEEIYNTGNPATNDKFILSNFYLIQDLYDTQGAERVIVTIRDSEKLDALKVKLSKVLKDKGYEVESKTWEELSMTYLKVKKMFGVIFTVLIIIIALIVLLTLLNTMQMAVIERTKEIGTIRAIGLLKRDVVKIFCIEGFVLAIVSCVLGIPILYLIKFALKLLDITFIPPVTSDEVPVLLMFDLKSIVIIFVLFCLASLISSYLATNKIAKQKIITSLSQMN